MAKYIGRLINVWFGIESTRGTEVPATIRAPKTDLTMQEKIEPIVDESSIGVITANRDTFVGKSFAEWDIGGNIEVNSFGYVLLAMLGSVWSVTVSWATTHTFDLVESNTHKSLTVHINDPVEWGLQFPLSCLSSCTISCNEGEQATYSLTLMSKKPTTTTHTVTYTTDYKLLSRHSVFKLATNLAGLWAASGNCLKSFEITFEKNLEADYCLGALEPRDFLNWPLNITGSFTAMYESEATYKALYLAQTKRALRFELIDTATTIGSASNPTLRIDLPLVAMTEFNKEWGNNDIVTQTVSFEGLHSNTDGTSVEAVLINTKASYLA